ncbi:MAG: tRNA (N6-isopentenyl adenosine(37)-C2)-methylthiotransferase MiaB [Deltaproteobacteria bacterium]|nr:tRNA (N6-isopentenyl adenosine(37)-C2)-methylthiotransferase MiaB [Deltaproteobacteria bacterium]
MSQAPRYVIETFGCQMNVHDSQRMEDALRAHGWVAAEGEHDADLIVLNTCSVREKAEHKLRSEVGRLRPLKRGRPDLVVAVAGCVAQQEGEKLLRAIPHLDVVVGPDNLAELPLLAETIRNGGPPVARTVFDLDRPTFLSGGTHEAVHEKGVCAFVTTMKGCDERCSFCVVPYTRGPERYRPLDEIVDEVRTLVARGVREVTLLGQTVNSWMPPEVLDVSTSSHDQSPSMRASSSHFATLLRTIAREVPALGRLRYTSPHPRHLTAELIDAHGELPVLARHLHLPVQSGSDRMLKRMIRRYTREAYLERVNALRARVPGLTLSTDVIVGFPGETDDDFAHTLSLVREAGFVALFGFKFSPRPFTPALKLADDVPEAVKDERLAALFAAVAVQQQAHLASLVDSTVTVLIEGESRPNLTRQAKFPTRVMGRTERNEIVHLDVQAGRDPSPLVGRFLEVRVSQANAHSLVGALAEADVRDLPEARAEPPKARRSLTIVSEG